MYMKAAASRLNERPIRGLTCESVIASSVSTTAEIGTDSRQKSSARSTRPSAARSGGGGIGLRGGGRVPNLGGLDPPPKLLELDDPVFGGTGLAFVAPAVR